MRSSAAPVYQCQGKKCNSPHLCHATHAQNATSNLTVLSVLLCLLATLSHQLPFIWSGSGLSSGMPASDWCLGLQMFTHLPPSDCFQSDSLDLVQMENSMNSESSVLA